MTGTFTTASIYIMSVYLWIYDVWDTQYLSCAVTRLIYAIAVIISLVIYDSSCFFSVACFVLCVYCMFWCGVYFRLGFISD